MRASTVTATAWYDIATDHYSEAERLVNAAREDVREIDPEAKTAYALRMDRASVAIAAAGVHARLAAIAYREAHE